MNISLKILLIVSIVPALLSSNAFAVQPYIAGYPDFAKVEASQVWLYNNFAGTTSGSLTSWIASVESVAGRTTTGSPNGYIYQMASKVNVGGGIGTDAEVHSGNTVPFDCDVNWANGCPTFGNLSTNSYLYQTMYWDGLKSKVTFYWENHFVNGTVKSYNNDYIRPSADTSRNFLIGSETVSGAKIKYLQIGAESASSTPGWNVYQYSGGFVQVGSGTKNLSSYATYSARYDAADPVNHTLITYLGSTAWPVGQQNYVANADYDLKSGSTLSPGQVKWFKSSTELPAGTRLW